MRHTSRCCFYSLLVFLSCGLCIAVLQLQPHLAIEPNPPIVAPLAPIKTLPITAQEPEIQVLAKRFCHDKWILPVWAELQKDAYFRESGSYGESGNCADMLESMAVDLNNDGVREIMLRGRNFHLCGATGNCGFWVFAKRGKRYRKLLSSSDYFEARELGDQIIKSKTKGYRDISLKGHITALDTSYSNYRFNGERYVERNCVVESYVMALNKKQTVKCKDFTLY